MHMYISVVSGLFISITYNATMNMLIIGTPSYIHAILTCIQKFCLGVEMLGP